MDQNYVVDMLYKQLEIWAVPYTEHQSAAYKVDELQQTVNNVRRGLFRRFHELQDKVMALEEEIIYLRGKSHVNNEEISNI